MICCISVPPARDVERGQAAVAELAAQGLKAFFHTLDVDSRESIVACRDFMVQHYGGVDILINNAARMTVWSTVLKS